MNKYITSALILLVVGVMVAFHYCATKPTEEKPITSGAGSWATHIPASISKYKIEPVVNEVGLIKLHPEYNTSECGLSDEDFVRYARSKIDYERQYQFTVFTLGKPLVGERCLKTALIFYLK